VTILLTFLHPSLIFLQINYASKHGEKVTKILTSVTKSFGEVLLEVFVGVNRNCAK